MMTACINSVVQVKEGSDDALFYENEIKKSEKDKSYNFYDKEESRVYIIFSEKLKKSIWNRKRTLICNYDSKIFNDFIVTIEKKHKKQESLAKNLKDCDQKEREIRKNGILGVGILFLSFFFFAKIIVKIKKIL